LNPKKKYKRKISGWKEGNLRKDIGIRADRSHLSHTTSCFFLKDMNSERRFLGRPFE
jgi:hypothetical protein